MGQPVVSAPKGREKSPSSLCHPSPHFFLPLSALHLGRLTPVDRVLLAPVPLVTDQVDQREAQGASGKQGSESRGYSSLAPLPPHQHVSIARCVTSMMTVPSGDTSSMVPALKASRTQFPLLIPAAWGGKSFPLWLVSRASPFPASSPHLPISLSVTYYSVIVGVTRLCFLWRPQPVQPINIWTRWNILDSWCLSSGSSATIVLPLLSLQILLLLR